LRYKRIGISMSSLFFRKNNDYRIAVKVSDLRVSLLVIDCNVLRSAATSTINTERASKVSPQAEAKLANVVLKESIILKEASVFDLDNNFTLDDCQQALKKYINSHGLFGLPCFCVLDDSSYELLLVDTPLVPEDEIADALRWQVQELIDSDIDDMVIESFKQPNKNKTYAAVSKKQSISQLVNFVAAIGLKLISIDIPELSYRNLVDGIAIVTNDENVTLDIEQASDKSLALVQSKALLIIGEGEGHLLIFKNSNIYLSRKFPIRSVDSIENDELEDTLVLEIQRSLDYFERQTDEIIPNTILFIDTKRSVNSIKYITILEKNLQQNILPLHSKDILHELKSVKNDVDMLMLCGAALRTIAA
jgi:MSHA biogenesis protein MshI